jgi:hypothetical protein
VIALRANIWMFAGDHPNPGRPDCVTMNEHAVNTKWDQPTCAQGLGGGEPFLDPGTIVLSVAIRSFQYDREQGLI